VVAETILLLAGFRKQLITIDWARLTHYFLSTFIRELNKIFLFIEFHRRVQGRRGLIAILPLMILVRTHEEIYTDVLMVSFTKKNCFSMFFCSFIGTASSVHYFYDEPFVTWMLRKHIFA
jgi:hypothetical protein